MQSKEFYKELKKPKFSPPAWIFGPVWTFLYILIAISFGYVCYKYSVGIIPFRVFLPFILNLLFNVIYTPIQFGLKNLKFAAIDVILVVITLIWACIEIYSYAHWIVYINIPYLLWSSFATVLQITITLMNRNFR